MIQYYESLGLSVRWSVPSTVHNTPFLIIMQLQTVSIMTSRPNHIVTLCGIKADRFHTWCRLHYRLVEANLRSQFSRGPWKDEVSCSQAENRNEMEIKTLKQKVSYFLMRSKTVSRSSALAKVLIALNVWKYLPEKANVFSQKGVITRCCI